MPDAQYFPVFFAPNILSLKFFGNVPENLHQTIKNKLKIPISKKTRSLNVAMTVAIVASEALRQNNFIK